MKNRKVFAVIAAMLSMFFLVGIAAAQDQVTVSVTSEPIQQNASCDKAGGFSLSFDSDTVLAAGDVITIDLDFGVVLCRTIDIEISDSANQGVWTPAVVMTNTNNDPIYYQDDSTTPGDLVGTNGIYFTVQGAIGAQRMTLRVFGPNGSTDPTTGSLTVGSDPADALVLKFLDQDTTFDNPGIWTDNTLTGTYEDPATLIDNTICINVSNFDENKVQANMDSAEDKFTFLPSNPQIAHIVNPHAYSFVTCKDRLCGDVLIGSRTSSQAGVSESCPTFDNEDYYGSGSTGYYTDYCHAVSSLMHWRNNIIIRRTDANFDNNETYSIRLTILVNGETGDNGVFFTNDPVRTSAWAYSSANVTAACAAANDSGSALVDTHYNASGAVVTAAAASGCDVATANRAVSLLTTANAMGFTGAESMLWVNVPALMYDLDEVDSGDVVSFQIELLKAPCGELFSGEWCIGTLVSSCPVEDTTVAGRLVFPYFSAMSASADTWWDGMVVDNMSSTAGTFTATIYEKDGDMGTYTSDTINGYSQFVGLLSNMLADTTLTSGSGTMGDSSCYVVVCTSWGTAADGFGMLGSTINNAVDGSETMGYLPRVSGTCSN